MKRNLEHELFPYPEEEENSASRQQLRQALDEYAIFRGSLRDLLSQSGVYSNPGWLDSDIVAHLASKLKVENRYDLVSETFRERKQRGLRSAEISEKEDFESLFNIAGDNIKVITETENPNDLGERRFYLNMGVSFFWNEKRNTLGVDFSRQSGRLMGETNYIFDLEKRTVSKTGYVGYNFGNESLPGLIYAPLDRPMGEFADIRYAPLEVDLSMLKDLNSFIGNPIKNRNLAKELRKLPGEERLLEKS